MKAKGVTRRHFLGATMGVAAAMTVGGALSPVIERIEAKDDPDVGPAEDLMREHGVLRRVLLIYQEWIRRLGLGEDAGIDTLTESNRIIRSFVEDYHEKLEEDYLFPRLQKAGKLTDLVDVLLQQHEVGRQLTQVSYQLSNMRALQDPNNRNRLADSLQDFARMYRPHAAREDTILFPAFHEMMNDKEYDELGDTFEKKENELFGQRGFERIVDRVATIEKKLGIYELAQFTPQLQFYR